MLDFLILLPGIPIGIRHQPVYFPIIEQPFFSVCFSQDCFCQGNDFPLPVWGRRNWYLLQISAQDFQGMELPAVKELGTAIMYFMSIPGTWGIRILQLFKDSLCWLS